jgi:hypothetical protein
LVPRDDQNYPRARSSRRSTFPVAVIGKQGNEAILGKPAFQSEYDSCYAETMSKQKKTTSKSTKSGRFTIGTVGFSKISAIEGIRITPVMKKRAGEARARGLTAEEYRRMITRSYRKD